MKACGSKQQIPRTRRETPEMSSESAAKESSGETFGSKESMDSWNIETE